MDIDEVLRKEIEKSGRSRYRIAKDTGVSAAQLCRFMQGRTFTAKNAEVLLRYFGYEITKKQ